MCQFTCNTVVLCQFTCEILIKITGIESLYFEQSIHLFYFSELNVASVDKKLCVTVAKNVSKTVKMFCVKSEQLVGVYVQNKLILRDKPF